MARDLRPDLFLFFLRGAGGSWFVCSDPLPAIRHAVPRAHKQLQMVLQVQVKHFATVKLAAQQLECSVQ